MYNKLFAKILDSSIWLESTTTRIVWLTFLAAMDETGFVQFASVPNVANRARVPLSAAETAIKCLESPDPNSGDPDNEGRRIEKVPGGWMVLNAAKYRDIVTRAIQQAQTRARVTRHRAAKRAGNAPVTPSNDPVTPSDTEVTTETKAIKSVSSVPSKTDGPEHPAIAMRFKTIGVGAKEWHLLQSQVEAWSDAFPGIDVMAECKKAGAWLAANKRKTAGGMPRFLAAWLTRCVDRVSRPGQQVNTHRPAALPTYASDWFEECSRLHANECDGQMRHAIRMQVEADA